MRTRAEKNKNHVPLDDTYHPYVRPKKYKSTPKGYVDWKTPRGMIRVKRGSARYRILLRIYRRADF